MRIYGKLGTQPAFFYFKRLPKFKVGKKVQFALHPGKYTPKLDGVVDNVEPLRISYL